jgi:shikimate kinase
MATGKSSVGKRLAEILGRDFLDLDAMIEAEEGMPISQIFAQRGEPAFRTLEVRMVERVAERSGCVIAAGGGTILNPKNLETLKRNGVVIALEADADAVLSRIGDGEDRPLLRVADKRGRIRELMELRKGAYAMADIAVDTSRLSIEEVARLLVERLREQGENL